MHMWESLNRLRESLGMDRNNFYSMVAMVVVTLLPIVSGKISKWIQGYRENKTNQLFKSFYRSDLDVFYCYLLIGEMIGLCICVLLGEILVIAGSLFLARVNIVLEQWVRSLLLCVYVLVLLITAGNIVEKMPMVRKKVLGKKHKKILFYLPLVIMYSYIICEIWNTYPSLVQIVSLIGLAIIEVVGIKYFSPEYAVYQYVSVRFYLDNGEVVDCPNIENIRKTRKLLIINEGERYTRMYFDKIWKVEYYGGPKVINKRRLKQKDYIKDEKHKARTVSNIR